MKRKITSLLAIAAGSAVVFAAAETQLRMHVFQDGDDGAMSAPVAKIDSVKFTYDTLEGKKLYTSEFYNDGELFATLENCSYDSVPVSEPTRDTTVAYTYTFRGWKRDESDIAKNKLTYNAAYDSTIRSYAVAFIGENHEVYSLAPLAYGTTPTDPLDNGVNPTKASTRLHDFVFKAWEPTLAQVEADIVYWAQFTSTPHPYTGMFYNCGTLFKEVDGCAYDYEPAIDTPKRDSTDYAYEFTGWSKDTSKVAHDTLIYTAVYDSSFIMKKNGAIRYAYKVSASDSVYFSQGNLQFNAMQGMHATADSMTQGTWRFAENQYDYIGDANRKISSTYEGWVDLFGWGTSGWNSLARCYQPWSKLDSYAHYCPGENSSNDLTGNYANADWGVYNAISNGGNEPNKWRTLTTSEWQYLFKNNKWTLGYIKTSEKDSSLCFFLIPDGFTAPSGVKVKVISTNLSLSNGYLNNLSPSRYAGNTYTTEQFASLESSGVVALPCGGRREISGMFNVGLYGCYWSSSASDSYGASELFFDSTNVCSNCDNFRYSGLSVRLVQDLNLDIHFVNADGTTLLDTTVARGTKPTYTRGVPTKDSTDYAYQFKGWDKEIVEAECNMVYTAVYDSSLIIKKNGALVRAAYKISETESVYFSQGNLQFTAQGTHKTADSTAQGTWRFAENQYEYIGSANSNISSTYDGWIDLFGWGTSGWNSGATAYQPWATSKTNSDYYSGESESNSLTGDYAKADWGVYNAISNGGNEPNKWRTLTTSEWQYLFKNNKWTLGYIKDGSNSHLCFMLIPDAFTAPEGINVDVIGIGSLSDDHLYMSESSYSNNTYTVEQFSKLEQLGVVVLPCAGFRTATSVDDVGSYGGYWSSSADGLNYAYSFFFRSAGVMSSYSDSRYIGGSVRLVQDL